MDEFRLLELLEEIEDDAEVPDLVGRRQYRLMDRIQMESFDDVDFKFRFRVSKFTFVTVLDMIRADLEYVNPR